MSNEGPKRGPLNVGQSPPTVLPSQGGTTNPPAANAELDKFQIEYDVVVKPNLNDMPAAGELFLDETVTNQEVAYKAKDLDGKIVRGKINLSNLQAVNAKLVNNKLIQDAVNTDKKIITDAIRASATANNIKLFRDAQALKEAKEKEEQADATKALKKRQDEINKVVSNPRAGQEASNAAEMQRLSAMSMEGLAVKMIVEEIFWIFKTVLCLQYFEDRYHYDELYKKGGASLIYDLTSSGPTGPKNKPLYSFHFKGEKIVLDVDKPIKVEELVGGKYRLADENKPDGYTDAMIIMANGYLPPPTLLNSLKKEFLSYVEKQVGTDLDPRIKAMEANLYQQIEEKDKDKEIDADKEKRDRQIANNLANRPAPPKPTPGK